MQVSCGEFRLNAAERPLGELGPCGPLHRYGDVLDVNANVDAVLAYLERSYTQQAALLPALLPDSGLSCLVSCPAPQLPFLLTGPTGALCSRRCHCFLEQVLKQPELHPAAAGCSCRYCLSRR